ncbi:unnamed protein product [Sympodiomycopsis kandeliae]
MADSQPPSSSSSSSTIYINNLNERVKLDVLKQSLNALFSTYGNVLSITAHGNLRMRGQAFVAFDDTSIAAKAIEEVNGFPLYGKAMQLSFAKTPSDSVLIKSTGSTETSEYQAHKSSRLQRKSQQQEQSKRDKKAKQKGTALANNKRKREGEDDVEESTTSVKKAIPQIPDEYLPPNPILFIQNVPTSSTKEDLSALFTAFEGLQDVRTIPNNTTIAFVEYENANQASIARDAVNGRVLVEGNKGLRITFARS